MKNARIFSPIVGTQSADGSKLLYYGIGTSKLLKSDDRLQAGRVMIQYTLDP